MKDYILKTKNITKKYGKSKALHNINMQIKRGTIYGLIGKNGAGKTTLLKVLSGLTFQSEGEVFLFGKKTSYHNNLLERVGVLIENPGLYPNLTAKENMKLKCKAYGINQRGYIERILKQVGLDGTGKKKTKKFSLGMKQRLGIALALVGEPDLLLLDEPVNGLDPQGIIEIRDTLLKLSKENNITIVISSHILEELSKISTRIGIIDEGILIEELDKEELLEKSQDRLEIMVDKLDRATTVLEDKLAISNYKVIDKKTIYIYEKIDESAIINREFLKEDIEINSLFVNRESLEEYFTNLTGGDRND